MQVVILAGGRGSRLAEETSLLPKPMVEIGGHPILWHLMKFYGAAGFHDFIILSGYKSHLIKEYFINYYQRYSDLTIDLAKNEVSLSKVRTEPWKVTVLYTGQNTQTGGRLKRAQSYLKERFMLTYGDGLSDLNLAQLIASHQQAQKLLTITAVRPQGRFGAMEIAGQDDLVACFKEKPEGEQSWINGGFLVAEPRIFDFVPNDDQCSLESEVLPAIAAQGQLHAFKHEGFWHPMDTLKEKNELSELWYSDHAPWKKW